MAKRVAAEGTGPSPKKNKTGSSEAAAAAATSLELEPSVQELLLAQAALERPLKVREVFCFSKTSLA